MRLFSLSPRAVLLALAMALVTTAAVLPQLAPPTHHHLDKLIHMAAFVWPALAAAVLVRDGHRVLLWGVGLALFGMMLEVAQLFSPGRAFSIKDGIANAVGITLGLAIGHILRRTHPAQVEGVRSGVEEKYARCRAAALAGVRAAGGIMRR